jgi:hypothetical protein
MTLPEAVMKHQHRQRLLSLGGVGSTEIAPEQGRDTQGGKCFADSKESDGILRNVVARNSEVA